MAKFLAGMAVGWLTLRFMQVVAEDRAFATQWDAFSEGMRAMREHYAETDGE